MGTPRKDITGNRYGKLVAMSRVPEPGQAVWIFKCDCGVTRTIAQRAVMRGQQSCGCLMRKVNAARMTKHGGSKPGMKHPLYDTWKAMRQRCNDTASPDYKYYGGRGIKICERWNDFMSFVEDMGDKPTGTTLDRKDNNGDYTPENCKWSTDSEQNSNRNTFHYLLAEKD